MRTYSILSSIVVLMFVSGAAMAADSECQLVQSRPDGSNPRVLQTCAIPGNNDTDCSFNKIGVIEPVCAFRSWIVACGFSREASTKAADLLQRKGTKGTIGTLRVAKGFLASGGSFGANNISVAFKEADGQPNYGLICGPK